MFEADDCSWHPVLTSDMAARAVDIALDVSTRMSERERVEAAVVAAKRQTAYPKSTHWQPSGVAQGYAGLAIMCGYLDACFPADDWDVIGHSYLELAARDLERQSYVPAGMFAGLSGLAFAAWS